MALGKSQIRGAFGTGAGAGNLVGRDRRLRPECARGRAERVLAGGGRSIDPAVDVDGRRHAGAQHHTATATTARAMVIGSAARVGRPRIRPGPTTRIDGETAKRAGLGHHDYRSACAATAAAVIQRDDAGTAVGRDGAGPDDAAGSDHDDGAAVAAAACVGRTRVVARSGSAAGSGRDTRRRGREGRSTKPAHRLVRIPGIAAHPAGPAVRAPTTARVLVVGRRVRICPAAAGGRRCSSGCAAVGVPVDQVVHGAAGARVKDILGRPGDALAFLGVEVVRAQVDVIRTGPAGAAGELAAEARAKAFLADADGSAVQVERAVDVENQDTAGGSVESPGGESARERGGHVLRHPDDLEVALSLKGRRQGTGVGIEQPAADGQGATHERYGAGCHRVLVESRAVEAGPAARRVTGNPIAVCPGVGRIDGGVLHLDHHHKVADRDRRPGARGRAERDGGRPGRDRERTRVVGVDHAVQGRRAVAPRSRAGTCRLDRGRRNYERDDRGPQQKDADPPAVAQAGHFLRANGRANGNRRLGWQTPASL